MESRMKPPTFWPRRPLLALDEYAVREIGDASRYIYSASVPNYAIFPTQKPPFVEAWQYVAEAKIPTRSMKMGGAA